MPPWVASVPRSTILRRIGAIDRLLQTCRCRDAAKSRLANVRVRSVSTHVAPTAINLRPNIPPRNKELHDALSTLSGAAETYVNISRLQLALQGLAAQEPVARVAVLGLDGQKSARQLARLLLADPLSAEGQWERALEHADVAGDQAVLLKFGEDGDSQTPTPLYKVLSVPSRVLRAHNLEILVSTLNVNAAQPAPLASAESSREAILVPKLQATSARGTPVPYPVHKTLLLGQGLDSAIAFGRFTADNVEETEDVVKVAVDLPAPADDFISDEHNRAVAINIEVGAKALTIFRESVHNSIAYEHGWFKSGLPNLTEWLVHDLQSASPIKPTVQALVTSIVDDVETNITKEEVARRQKAALTPTDEKIIDSITGHLASWAEQSHTELRDELDEAFSSRNWHKLSWWKLLWRVDDVTMISSEVLERKWLVRAEKDSIYLAGRMNQAGFPEDIQRLPAGHIPEATTLDTAPTAENQRTDLSTDLRRPLPWPEHIASARTELINDTVPPLQALAQRLLLQTFSTTSLSSAASALLYVSSTCTVFEASAVAALGLTFSLRRMQKLWEGARESWQATVREEGRRTLKGTEETARMILKTHKRREMTEDESVARRREARQAASRVREALGRLSAGGAK
ncbi:hypothetical protein ACN47E_008279 [Coniothyrium glycines]